MSFNLIIFQLLCIYIYIVVFTSKVPQQLVSSTKDHHAGGNLRPPRLGFEPATFKLLYRVYQKKNPVGKSSLQSDEREIYENFQ